MNYLTQGVINISKEGISYSIPVQHHVEKPTQICGLCAFKELIGYAVLPRCRFVKDLT